MSTQIQPFNFNSNQVRIEIINNKEYFCAKDVCDILGYSNGKDAVSRHCKKDGVVKYALTDALGRMQEYSFISEPNLYRLISHSKLPEAEKFEAWVFEEVLPIIRKTGKFDITPQLPQNYIQALEYLVRSEKDKIELQTQNVALENTVKQKETIIEEKDAQIEVQDATIDKISNIQDTYSLRQAKGNLFVTEGKLKEYLFAKKWFQYLSNGKSGAEKKNTMQATAYAVDRDFAKDVNVENRKQQRFFKQFRITKHGMAFLIKHRNEYAK